MTIVLLLVEVLVFRLRFALSKLREMGRGSDSEQLLSSRDRIFDTHADHACNNGPQFACMWHIHNRYTNDRFCIDCRHVSNRIAEVHRIRLLQSFLRIPKTRMVIVLILLHMQSPTLPHYHEVRLELLRLTDLTAMNFRSRFVVVVEMSMVVALWKGRLPNSNLGSWSYARKLPLPCSL